MPALESASGALVIFGFNTDVKYADTVYHVQSEARKHELLLQTQVFVKGRCIGKHATSYAAAMEQPGFSEEHMHEMLKTQHKHFVDAVRAGQIEAELAAQGAAEVAPAPPPPAAAPPAPPPAPAPSPEDIFAAPPKAVEPATEPPGGGQPTVVLEPMGQPISKGLELRCLNPETAYEQGSLLVQVQVTDETGAVANAQIASRLSSSQTPTVTVYSQTGPSGGASVSFSLTGMEGPDASILVQATAGGKSAIRRFRLRTVA